MNRQEIEEKLKDIITDKLGWDQSEIFHNSDLTEDLGADSLDKIELMVIAETAFGITIPDDDAERVVTFKQLVDLVEKEIK